MACNLIGVESLVEFGIVVALIWLSAGTRNAAFAVANDALCADKSVYNCRSNCEW